MQWIKESLIRGDINYKGYSRSVSATGVIYSFSYKYVAFFNHIFFESSEGYRLILRACKGSVDS